MRHLRIREKKYFYVLRPILACKWIEEKKCPSSVLFDELLNLVLEDDMSESIADLLAKKVKMSESNKASKIEKINSYLEKKIEYYKSLADSMEDDRKPKWESLEKSFEKVICKFDIHDPMFLAQKSVPATDCAEDRQTIADLLDTLKAHLEGCVGMAANMIGVKKMIIVVSMGFVQVAMVNPKIAKRTKPYQTEEGCLSLLDGPRKCTRYDEIEVEYLDATFASKKGKFTGFTAQIMQHECDHCNGVLI